MVCPSDFVYPISVHDNCVCNEVVALHNRHLVDRTYIPFDESLWRWVARQTVPYYPSDLVPSTYQQVVAAYTGRKKRMYYNAMQRLNNTGYKKEYSHVSMFVKPDKIGLDVIGSKDPRAIQFRRPEFNLYMGRYIKAYEHELYGSLTMGVVSNTRIIAKGLNNYQRADLIIEKSACFDNPRYVLLDHSRFDSTINTEHLKSTHRKYQRAFRSRTLQQCCRSQLKNKCWSRGGIRYNTTATRMSGDPDTGCGNTIVNADCLWGFLHLSGVNKFDIILDGDDSIVFVEANDVSKLDFTIFGRLGFDTKHEIVDDITQAEFCQCRLVRGNKNNMMRNPMRVLSNTACSRRKYADVSWPAWIAANGHCELSTNTGMPILQSFGSSLIKLSRKRLFDDQNEYRKLDVPLVESQITTQARMDVYTGWGIPPYVQELMEAIDWTSYSYIQPSERTQVYTKQSLTTSDSWWLGWNN